MAENDSSQEKTEEPTEKRLRESREKGQVARSKELSTLAVTLGGSAALLMSGGILLDMAVRIMRACFSQDRSHLFDPRSMSELLVGAGYSALEALVPFLLLLFIASFVGTAGIGGVIFSAQALAPKASRLNPLEGIKRMFSVKALVELVKALAKFSVVLVVALVVMNSQLAELTGLPHEPLLPAMLHSVKMVGWSLFIMSASLVLIAAVDVPFQIWDNAQKLKMTKQEVRDEYKDSEGKPEVKSKIRQLQREMAERRMMGEVPKADVVITNPTHFSVALKYEPEKGGAPRLVAKGADFLAFKIREVAVEHEVIILPSPALARAVYYSTELEQEIPAGLYLAIAQVLAYIYQLRQYQEGKGKRPASLKDLPIPDDLQHD
ncbi:flagellar biosynthesis protein FlhB [Atopomonas sediminilitoris]|uniref:flagellar biosynthesis protein FlhB n=1 Tax=Atopomonas sediminilitoris TaxID=2919919 RepID=UPI001F4E7178|nr:flagellar biosynthesis protein FlhB [Atopomonas sediminilitoris]MCJ8167936.1 flagellar biosynthesis protein FlhB [Atopomonas sediminilitoris]